MLALQSLYPVIVATLTAIGCCALAIALHRPGRRLQWLIPVSGGLLLGVAAFGLIPEVALEMGWPRSLCVVAIGFMLLMLLDRFAFRVCPACAHDHDHHSCVKALHGFVAPLVAAIAIHAFVDGWGLVTVQVAGPQFAGSVAAAIVLHKIPEGLALGTMLRAATTRPGSAFLWCLAAETPTLLGGLTGGWITPATWVHYPLAIAAGTFLFLGLHAVHGDWKQRGALKTAVPAFAGGAGAALLQLGLRSWIK